MRLRRTSDRVQQVDAMRRLAEELLDYNADPELYESARHMANEYISYWLSQAEPTLPDWFDQHDFELLTNMVEENLLHHFEVAELELS